jgi:hypothetical protein
MAIGSKKETFDKVVQWIRDFGFPTEIKPSEHNCLQEYILGKRNPSFFI